jgi:hypothetical protein
MPVEGGEETLVVEGLSDPGNFVVASRGIYFLAVGQSREETSIDFVENGTGRRTTIVKARENVVVRRRFVAGRANDAVCDD